MNTVRSLQVLALLLLFGCATSGRNAAEPADEETHESPIDVALTNEKPAADRNSDEIPEAEPACVAEKGKPCVQNGKANEPLLDRTQQTVYNVVNSTSKWFDGFFGATDVDQEENVSRGRLNASVFRDERDGTRTRLRMRARIPLPATKRRARLVIGRGDVDEFVDGNQSGDVDTLPGRFDDFEDDDWLLGVGFSRHGDVPRGWDFGVGIRLTTPLEPYVRMTYRWNRSYGESWLWRVQPRVFWQNQRGAGASLTNILDYALGANWLLRSWSIVQGEDEIEGLGWTQRFFAYQALSKKGALSYSIFAVGETLNEVPVLDYGIELRYRKRVARDWLFVIFSTQLNWPKEFAIEERRSNFGVGIEFEMRFGDWPSREQESPSAESPATSMLNRY